MTSPIRIAHEPFQPDGDVTSPIRDVRSPREVWGVAASLLLLGVLAFLFVDFPVSRHFVVTGRLPGDFAKLFEAAEHFGTIWGQLLILCVVFELDRRRAYRIPRIVSAAILGGLAASLLKLSAARIRPKRFEFTNQGIEDSFIDWFRMGAGGADLQSFPSGHTASAVAFAVALGWAYPKARPIFLVLAGLVAFQRIESTAHFVSDTFVGAAIGFIVASWLVENTRFSRWWTAREAVWSRVSDSLVDEETEFPSDATQRGCDDSLDQSEPCLIPFVPATESNTDHTTCNSAAAA